MNIDYFDYFLPDSLIANQPAEPRDASRLMVIERMSKKLENRKLGT